MKADRFFSTIWRINALLLLGVGALAAVLLSAVAYRLLEEAVGTRQASDIVNTVSGEIEEEIRELGPFEVVAGAGVSRAPLEVQQTYSLGSGSKEAGSTRNYLYYDPASRVAHWLKPSMSGLILEARTLPERAYRAQDPAAEVVVYVCVERDSDGDDRLTRKDLKQIAVSDPRGRNYRVVVEQADRLNEARMLGPDRLLILHTTGPKLVAVEINTGDSAAPAQTHEIETGTR